LTDSCTFQTAAGFQDQGENLRKFCRENDFDIINIASAVDLLDYVNGTFPILSLNGPICHGLAFFDSFGPCPEVAEAIKYCQSLGKEVFVRIPLIKRDVRAGFNEASAWRAAYFLWKTLGPLSPDWSGPRPFGDAVIDGFDFWAPKNNEGLEVFTTQTVTAFEVMAQTFRNRLFPYAYKQLRLSFSHGCLSTGPFSGMAERVPFDIVNVNFAHIPGCDIRKELDGASSKTFDDWIAKTAWNPGTKIIMEIAPIFERPSEVSETAFTRAEAYDVASKYLKSSPSRFGGMSSLHGDMLAGFGPCPGGAFNEFRPMINRAVAKEGPPDACPPPFLDTTSGTEHHVRLRFEL
jgi:chitinase